MPSQPSPIMEDIRVAIAVLAASDSAAASRVAEALDAWRARNQSFEEALGVCAGWRSGWRRAQRDQALHWLAAQYYPTLKGRELSRAVARDGTRYERSSAWARDRKVGYRPDGRSGAIWAVLQYGKFPSESSLRIIFNGLAG
jgi:hypothetical protein